MLKVENMTPQFKVLDDFKNMQGEVIYYKNRLSEMRYAVVPPYEKMLERAAAANQGYGPMDPKTETRIFAIWANSEKMARHCYEQLLVSPYTSGLLYVPVNKIQYDGVKFLDDIWE